MSGVIDTIAADPLAFAWVAFVAALVIAGLAIVLMEYKREIDRRTIKEAEDAEAKRLGVTYRRDFTYRRTEPAWAIRAKMQQRRAA